MAANNGSIKLVAGNSNRSLSEAIGAYLQTPLTRAEVRRFADMEIFVEIKENVRGADVYVLQSTLENCVRVPINTGGPVEVEQYGDQVGPLCDGMAFDADGHLIVTLPNVNRLVVMDPSGTVSTLVDDPERVRMGRPSNCAFGGPGNDELFIAHIGADHVGRLPLGRRGHVLFNLRR